MNSMWHIVLPVLCFGVILEIGSQELTLNSQTLRGVLPVNHGVGWDPTRFSGDYTQDYGSNGPKNYNVDWDLTGHYAGSNIQDYDYQASDGSQNYSAGWDSTGPAGGRNIEDGDYNVSNGPKNEITKIYPNQGRPVITPVGFHPHDDKKAQLNNEQFHDHRLNPVAAKPSFSDINDTYPSAYPFGERDKQSYQPNAAISSSGPAIPLQNPSVSQTFPIIPPMFYPPTFSINVRRRFTNSVRGKQNSSDTQVAEPVTSSFEERYSQILPPFPLPGMPFIPDNSALPHNSYASPNKFYPPATSAYIPPYSILPPDAQEALQPIDNFSFDRMVGVANAPPLEKQPNIERSILTDDARAFHDIPRDVTNSFIPPSLPPLFGRFPFVWTKPVIPAVMPNLGHPETGRPVPVDDVHAGYDIPEGAQNNFVPPDTLPSAFGRFPFSWPRPIIPAFIPSPVVPRVLPPNPSLVSEIVKTPESGPTIFFSKPGYVQDRLPLDSSTEDVPLEDSLPNGTLVQGSVRAISEQIKQEEIPDYDNVPYEFGFDMNDGKGSDQHRMEGSDAFGVVRGSYGYKDMFGVYRLVNYVADKNGFRAFVKSNEPGVSSSGSADVVVHAEQPPPPHAVVAEASTIIDEEAIIEPDEVTDLVAESSEKDI